MCIHVISNAVFISVEYIKYLHTLHCYSELSNIYFIEICTNYSTLCVHVNNMTKYPVICFITTLENCTSFNVTYENKILIMIVLFNSLRSNTDKLICEMTKSLHT